MKTQKTIIYIIVIFVFSSCAVNSSKPDWYHGEQVNETLKVDGKSYQVIDSETENLLEIKSTKTSFLMERSKDTQTWERLAFFFKFYLNSPFVIQKTQLEVKSIEGDFEYLILRSYLDEVQVSYQIKVVDQVKKKITSESKLKAKNLARFLKEGKLDQNLL